MTIAPSLDGPRLLPSSGRDPRQLIVLIHGYGSNGADMIALAPHWQAALPDAVFAAPNAPLSCAGFAAGYQWWALTSVDPAALAAGALHAAPALDAFLDCELARYGLSDDRLLLVGFSQGTMMALHVGPRRERPLGGIIGYSGALADVGRLATEVRSKPPILLIHGDADPLVPVTAMYQARDALIGLDFEVDRYVSEGLGHGVDPAGLELGMRFALRTVGGGE